MFALDHTSGNYPFSLAKTVDIIWDVGVGRSVQFAAGWISFSTFSAAMLRMIERHPASFSTFQHTTLDGTSLAMLWTLLRDLFRTQSKRTSALFFFMILSTTYIFSIPVLLGAMTGYDIATDAWVDIEGDSRGLIHMSDIPLSIIVYGARNLTFPNPQCVTAEYLNVKATLDDYESCLCQLPDTKGPILFANWRLTYDSFKSSDSLNDLWNVVGAGEYEDCRFDYPGNDKEVRNSAGDIIKCNIQPNMTVSFMNRTFLFDDLNTSATPEWCYGDRGYDTSYMENNLRCLPNAEQRYAWGFSTMLSTLFLIVHFVWSICIYIVWQDAQFKSKLVRSGFKLTQLRAIFALAAAAERATGLHNEALFEADTKLLDGLLFGSKESSKDGAVISSNIFEVAIDGESSLKGRKSRLQDDV